MVPLNDPPALELRVRGRYGRYACWTPQRASSAARRIGDGLRGAEYIPILHTGADCVCADVEDKVRLQSALVDALLETELRRSLPTLVKPGHWTPAG